MLYQVICADPPWHFDDALKNMKLTTPRSAVSNYKVMSLADITTMQVSKLADPVGCLLALWVPGSMLSTGLDVMSAWGFKLKQTFVWVKLKKDYAKETDWNNSTRVGMGHLFRQSHELALIGTSGKSVYPHLQNRSQRSVAFDLNVAHSVKPPTLQQRLEIMFPNVDKLELFARRQIPGWTCVGDAISGKDVDTEIDELIKL